MGTPKLVVSMILVLYFGQNELQNIKHFSFSMEIYAFAKCILLAFCLQTSNGRFWAANLFKLWKFSKFASISIPALCLEWIGSIRFSQKKGFLIVKNGQFLASKSWFDGKNSWKSNIVRWIESWIHGIFVRLSLFRFHSNEFFVKIPWNQSYFICIDDINLTKYFSIEEIFVFSTLNRDQFLLFPH